MRRNLWATTLALGLIASMVTSLNAGLAMQHTEEEGGNNLATPVIFAEGYGLSGVAVNPDDGTSTGLPGLLKEPCSGAESWGTHSNVTFPFDGTAYKLHIDGVDYFEAVGATTAAPGNYYLQPYTLEPLGGGAADEFGADTCFEADWADGSAIDMVDVNFLDVGDSLVRALRHEGGNPIRVEFNFYQSTETAGTFQDGMLLDGYPMTQLWPPGTAEGKPTTMGGGMEHNEVWGTAKSSDTGKVAAELASVYTQNARLTIHKLTWVELPDSFADGNLDGYPSQEIPNTFEPMYDNWVESVEYDGLVGGSEGELGFSSEVNQGGRVIYGFNWGVGTGVETGWYRITLSLDDEANGVAGNAFISAVNPADMVADEGEEPHEADVAVTQAPPDDTMGGKGFFPPTFVADEDGNYVFVDVYVAPSTASGQGNMNGQVTDTSGNPLEGTTVTVYDVAGSPAALAVTGSDGTFETTLIAGTYKVGIVDPQGNYHGEFFDNRTTLETADHVIVADMGTAYLNVKLSKKDTEPPPTGGHFTDVDQSNIFFAAIQWMWEAGISKGCNPPANDLYCPRKSTTRAQMASFFVRMLGLTEGGDVDRFGDDDGSVHEVDINRLAAAGITKGCNPPDSNLYCPGADVLRQQLAAFFQRAWGD